MRKNLISLLMLIISFTSYCEDIAQYNETKLNYAFRLIGNRPEQADSLARLTLARSVVIKDYTSFIKASRIIGQVNINWGNFDVADSVLQKAMQVGESQKLLIPYADILINYGNLYLKTGNYDEALTRYGQSKAIYVRENFTPGIIKSTTNIGICHLYFANYEKAAEAFHKALDIATQANYPLYRGLILNNLGRLQIKVENYYRAIYYLEQSVELLKSSGNLISTGRSELLIAKSLLLQGKYGAALARINETVPTLVTLEDHQGLTHASILKGEISQGFGQTDSAYIHYREAVSRAGKYKLTENLNQAQIKMSGLLLADQRYVEASPLLHNSLRLASRLKNEDNYYQTLKLFEKYYHANDRLDSVIFILKEMEDYVRSLEGKYDRIKLLESQKELKETETNLAYAQFSRYKSKQTILLLSFGLILVLFIGILIYFYVRTKQKFLMLRYKRNEEILRAKNVEFEKNREIEEARAEIKGQEKERSRLARELHDGLGGTLAAIKLNLSGIKHSPEPAELEKAIVKLDMACKEVRTISHHLASPVFDNNRLAEIIEKWFNNLQTLAVTAITYDIYPEDELDALPYQLKNDLYRIIQEITSNTIKHANAETLDVQLVMHKEYISLIAEDDGTGFNTSHDRCGIGLTNIKTRIESYNGVMLLDTVAGRGTVVDIQIPIL